MTKSTGQNAAQMRRMNRLRVLRLVRRTPIARSELAAETGLTRAAISLIVGELIGEGVLLETGRRHSRGGRKAVLLELLPNHACAAGLCIARTGAEVGLVDLSGRLLFSTAFSLSSTSLAAALTSIKQAIRRVHAAADRLCLGLGISTPGPVDITSGVILDPPNFDLWHGVNVYEVLRDTVGNNVVLANTAQALAIAERAYGKGREFDSFISLVVDSGIGAGIIRGDELYAGWHGFGSEVGHTSINYNGALCSCGLRGCVELDASTPAVVKRAQKSHPRLQTWEEFVDLAYSGDRVCCRLIDQQARAIATALVNALNILELEAVILTGDVLYRGEMIRASIERYINRSAINRRLHRIPIHLSSLREHHEVVASAGIILEKFFQGDLEPASEGVFEPVTARVS
jgi:predicted NBD/HSP70 family sugar kinase